MAPSYAKADENYMNAAYRLLTASTLLERHLPPVQCTDDETHEQPPLRPKRHEEHTTPCEQCEEELEHMAEDERVDHRCTHESSNVNKSAAGTETPVRKYVQKSSRGRQQNPGVIRQEVQNLDEKFDAYTIAVATFCSLMDNNEEIILYQRHLEEWTQYYGWIKDRAAVTINLIETPPVNTVTYNVVTNGTTAAQDQIQDVASGSSQMGCTQVLAAYTQEPQGNNEGEVYVQRQTDGIASLSVVGNGDTQDLAVDANLDLAIRAVNVLTSSVEKDLTMLEQEVSSEETPLTESCLNDLKELCDKIEITVSKDFKEASEKLALLDREKSTGAAYAMSQKMTSYLDRLRAVRSEIRKLRGSVPVATSSSNS